MTLYNNFTFLSMLHVTRNQYYHYSPIEVPVTYFVHNVPFSYQTL